MATFTELLLRYGRAFGQGKLAETARRLVAEVDLYAHARSTVKSVEAGARKVDAIDGLLRSLEGYEQRTTRRPSLAVWLARLALDSREEEDPEASEGVTLMSLHAAKGLEFPVVFLLGLEEDLLPCAGIQGEARDLEEERRLAYVGITRARERLYLTRAATRVKRGKTLARTPSRFLADLPAGAWEAQDAAVSDPQDAASRSAEVLAALRERLRGPA
jgi:DNA helicase-2/ATP-dependent DNA helicase PcrA